MRNFIITFFSCLFYCHALTAGILIEVCGIDGAGKTTFISDLSDALAAKGYQTYKMKPLKGDTSVYPFLDKVSSLAQNNQEGPLKDLVDKFKSDFFFLSFILDCSKMDRLLQENDYVICDRYLFAFRTYQECFNQQTPNDEEILKNFHKADVTFLLTLPVEIALSRMGVRPEIDSYENFEFLQKAQGIFLRDADLYSHLYQINSENSRMANIQMSLSILGVE